MDTMAVGWAMTLPNKKIAVIAYSYYMLFMIVSTFLNYDPVRLAEMKYYLVGFILGISEIFFILYYFTTQYEKLKQQEQDRLLEMDAFKTKFYTNITHEFRTPLTIINGLSDQLVADYQMDSRKPPYSYSQKANVAPIELHEGLNMISRNGNRLLSLTNQILDLSKIDEGSMNLHLVNGDIG